MNKKLILFDIDGTLIDCAHGIDYIREETKKALHKLKEAGHYIFIASGRPYCYLLDDLLQFDFNGYILNDGAQIIFNGNEYKYPMDHAKLMKIHQYVKETDNVMVAYNDRESYFYNDDGFLSKYAQTFKLNPHTMNHVDTLEDIFNDTMKIHVYFKDQSSYDAFELDESFHCMNDHNALLKEIFSKKHSKATALDQLLEMTGITLEDVYFFGDGFNDIEMLQYVKHGIVMDNAHDKVKQHAKYICGHVLDEGVASFINESGLFFKDE